MAAEVDRRVRLVEVDRGTEVHILLKDGRRVTRVSDVFRGDWSGRPGAATVMIHFTVFYFYIA